MTTIAVFLPSLAGGGAERVTLALADGLARRGYRVDLVVGTSSGGLREHVPASVELIDLRAPRTLSAGLGLARYLRRRRPDLVISAISHANVIAALAARTTVPRRRVVVMHHNTTSLSTRGTGRRRDRLLPLLCGLAYRLADRIVAVSHGVARDLAASSHLPAGRIEVVANPIDFDSIRELAAEDVQDELLPPGSGPLVLAAGRLEHQKGFDTLLRATARSEGNWRLAILGHGRLRDELSGLVTELGLTDRVALAGFVGNPYPYFRRASVFALSSRFEGLPTVLIESLAFPLRIVSTDCPSGPAEILDGVEASELVPVDDAASLAAALDRAVAAGPLDAPGERWRDYDVARVMAQVVGIVEATVAVSG